MQKIKKKTQVTEELFDDIKRVYDKHPQARASLLATLFGVGASTAARIRQYKTWARYCEAKKEWSSYASNKREDTIKKGQQTFDEVFHKGIAKTESVVVSTDPKTELLTDILNQLKRIEKAMYILHRKSTVVKDEESIKV